MNSQEHRFMVFGVQIFLWSVKAHLEKGHFHECKCHFHTKGCKTCRAIYIIEMAAFRVKEAKC